MADNTSKLPPIYQERKDALKASVDSGDGRVIETPSKEKFASLAGLNVGILKDGGVFITKGDKDLSVKGSTVLDDKNGLMCNDKYKADDIRKAVSDALADKQLTGVEASNLANMIEKPSLPTDDASCGRRSGRRS